MLKNKSYTFNLKWLSELAVKLKQLTAGNHFMYTNFRTSQSKHCTKKKENIKFPFNTSITTLIYVNPLASVVLNQGM